MADGAVHRGRKPVISREQVLDAAADALASGGVDTISLRAIARQLGVVSSAIYRHYPSREALLTDLITQTHAELGEWVVRAEASVTRSNLSERFAVIVRSTRAWAKANPHRWALLYGTPVPGYDGGEVRVNPAARVGELLAALVRDAEAAGHVVPPDPALDAATTSVVRVAASFDMPERMLSASVAGVEVWAQFFGHLSFEVFGHYRGVIDDLDVYTESLIERMSQRLGLAPSED